MEHVGTVESWSTERGAGVVHDDAGWDHEVDRSGLRGVGELEVGQSVEVTTSYDLERHEVTIEGVRVLGEDEAAVMRLTWLCWSVDAAVEEATVAAGAASDDDIEYRQGQVHEAAARERERVPEIGRLLHERGGEVKMAEILSAVDDEYRPRIAAAWQGIGSFAAH